MKDNATASENAQGFVLIATINKKMNNVALHNFPSLNKAK